MSKKEYNLKKILSIEKQYNLEKILTIEKQYNLENNEEVLKKLPYYILSNIAQSYRMHTQESFIEFLNIYKNNDKIELYKKFDELYHFIEQSINNYEKVPEYYKILLYYTELNFYFDITKFRNKYLEMIKEPQYISKYKESYNVILYTLLNLPGDENYKKSLKETIEYFLIEKNYINYMTDIVNKLTSEDIKKFILSKDSTCNELSAFYLSIMHPMLTKYFEQK